MRALLLLPILLASTRLAAEDKKDEKVKEQIAELTKNFPTFSPAAKLATIEKLAGLGEPAARALCDAMLDKDAKAAAAALAALEKVHPKLYAPVAKLVLDRIPSNREKALEELTEMGPKALPAIGLLAARGKTAVAAAEEDPKLAKAATLYLRAVSAIGPEEPETVAFYKDAITSNNVQIWTDALSHLLVWAGDKEARRKEVMPIIKAGLVDVPNAVPFIEAAGRYKALAKDCLPALKKLKLSSHEKVREAATVAVESIENAK